jgi:hypothetical protein
MKSIGVAGFSQKDINENVHGTSPILDPPTEKATRWDVIVIDMIRFKEFKG